ncbi:repetitive organellar protein-like [Metopolophium dirhodum]|uniref:repetitive organellar protein-like n=1 Tax=Metopolophium dirhodum TaxID=44670 RepID=UPI0029907CBB|nr:repetitive organellar protein-like [Metopolophium dirhodum]
MSDYFQQTNTSNQSANNDGNKKDEVIITFNYQPNGTGPSSDITENKIMVLDYMPRNINTNFNSFDNLNTETIVLHKLNMSYEDIFKTFKEKLMTKVVSGDYAMGDKDVINLDKMIGLACIAMSESEKNNKKLRTRHSILQNKYENYDYAVQECSRLNSEMDKIKCNLCLALGRRFNDKEDVMHLTNFCAALVARENEYHYILTENDKLKYIINNQLVNIRDKTLNNYDEVLQSLEKFKEKLYIKDLKISQLKDKLCLINEEKKNKLQLLHKNLSEFPEKLIDQNVHDAFDCSRNNDELYEGKMLITEQINQIQGSTYFESENHQLCDLINMFARLTTDKEEDLKTTNRRLIRNVENKNHQLLKEIDDYKKWQKHLENENDKLNSEFKDKKEIQKTLIDKENEHKKRKEDYSKMKLMCDELNEKNAHLIKSLDECRQRLNDRKIKCVDGDSIIKTLQSNLIEQTNKFELVNAKYNKEKEKCQQNETYTQQMMDEFTSCLQKKEINIALVQNECNDLKHQIKAEEDYIENLKHKVITLEYELNKKNKTIQEILKAQSKQHQQHTATPQISDNELEQQMDILLDNISTWQNIIDGYEKVLYNMQNAIQQQSKIRNYCLTKYQHLKDIEYKATVTENLIQEKEIILFQHQNEIEDIKEKYNLKIARMAETEVNLRNEIQDLKESLKQKSLHITIAEKIANLQLKESLATVKNHLYNDQVCR